MVLSWSRRRRDASGHRRKPAATTTDGPPSELTEGTDARDQLVDWMVQPDNPFFARALVNRVWGAYFGRGLVEPVDDMRASNPPVNAALLDALAKYFVQLKYDQKALIRTILESRLYQLSSEANATNAADTRNFSRSYRRRLRAEVLLDAVGDVTGVPTSFSATWNGARALETWNFKMARNFWMPLVGRIPAVIRLANAIPRARWCRLCT